MNCHPEKIQKSMEREKERIESVTRLSESYKKFEENMVYLVIWLILIS